MKNHRVLTIEEVVQKVSEIYREERGKVSDLHDELNSILTTLGEVSISKGKNISLADYDVLIKRKEEVIKEIQLKTQYYEGISCVREMLMDLGFDTEIK